MAESSLLSKDKTLTPNIDEVMEYVLDLNEDTGKAMTGIGRDLWEDVLRDMGSSESKASASELQEECEMHEQGIKRYPTNVPEKKLKK